MREVVAPTDDGALSTEGSTAAVGARASRLHASIKQLEALRNTVAAPGLVAKLNDVAGAMRFLELVEDMVAFDKASASTLKRPEPDLGVYQRALYVGTRERELARRAVVAQCLNDASLDQSLAWKADTLDKMRAFADAALPCLRREVARRPDVAFTLSMKIHIGPAGRVVLAGPDAPYTPLDAVSFRAEHPFSSDLEYCVTHLAETWVFAPPQGTAIIVVPLAHTPPAVGASPLP